jgi:hypothetical protein
MQRAAHGDPGVTCRARPTRKRAERSRSRERKVGDIVGEAMADVESEKGEWRSMMYSKKARQQEA